MEKEQLLNWIEHLVELHKRIGKTQGVHKTDLLNQLHGYIQSGEFIISQLKQ